MYNVLFEYTTIMATDNTRLWIDFDFIGIYATISCWLCTSRMYVCKQWCIFEFIGLITKCKMRYYYMARSQLHTHASCAVQKYYNDNNTRLRNDFNFVGMYETVLCWLWTSRKYVCKGAFLNSQL